MWSAGGGQRANYSKDSQKREPATEASARGTIWNFCYLNGSRGSPLLMYAIPLDVSEECLLDRWTYPSNNDLLRPMLINEGVSESLHS